MECILPLPAINSKNMLMLNSIFNSCTRSLVFHKVKYGAKNTNYFIDNRDDFNSVLDCIIKPLGIDPDDIVNLWNNVDLEYKCSGINFNVLTADDYLKPHIDYNPTKLNILISGKTKNHVHFVNEGETWDWSTPAVIDVSKLHYVSNNAIELVPRVTMQIFLTKSFDYYRNNINTLPDW
jgi:hypothetical protein